MKILIAEDEPEILKAYEITLEARGHEVVIAQDGDICLKEYKKELMEYQKRNEKKRSKKRVSTPTSRRPPFDVVVLDYRMPKVDGMQVAKKILKLYPKQRIIFASAYVQETLEHSVKQLKQVVELMQKPFEPDTLADTIEDKESYDGLKSLMKNIRGFNFEKPSREQIRDLFEGVRRIHKGRTF